MGRQLHDVWVWPTRRASAKINSSNTLRHESEPAARETSETDPVKLSLFMHGDAGGENRKEMPCAASPFSRP